MPLANEKDIKGVSEALDGIITTGNSYNHANFTHAYIDACFTIWYSKGKPFAKRLVNFLPEPSDFGIAAGKVSVRTLEDWIRDDFRDRGDQLDQEVSKQMSERLIAEKVQMLEAHAEIASQMQQMALEYLTSHQDKMNPNAAVRMLVEGVRIERESRGIPRTLEKLAERSDDELMAEIKNIMLMSTVDFLPPPDEDTTDAV